METVKSVAFKEKDMSVTITLGTGRIFKILYNDYSSLPFSCRENDMLETSEFVLQKDTDVKASPEILYYDGDPLKYLTFLSNKFKIYSLALSKLAYSDTSRKTLYYKLYNAYKRSGVDLFVLRDLCNTVCDEFVSRGYINDFKYALERARYLKASKKYGPYKIRQNLILKGITTDVLNEVFALPEFDDFSSELEALIPKLCSTAALSDPIAARKITEKLYRAGYSYEDISDALYKFKK